MTLADTMYDVEKQENTGRHVGALKQPQVVSMDQWKMPDWMQDVTSCVDQGKLTDAAELLTEDHIGSHMCHLSMPEKGFVLVALARLLKRMSEFERAEFAYKKLLTLCPTNTSVLNEMANVLEEQGKTEAALGYLKRAIEVDPHDPRLWANLVRTDSSKTDFGALGGCPASSTTRCWCGEPLERSVHPAYGRCVDCGTFVLLRQYTNDQLNEFYTFDKYWHTQAVQVKNLPPIEQRVVDDLKDRIPALYGLLKNYMGMYNPLPDNLLEIGCAHGGFLAYCRKNGIQNIVGNEPDEATCQFAKEIFDLPHLVTGLFPDVSLPFDQFGVIVGFDVVEHFSEPVQALKKVSALLGERGICIFQLPCYRNEDASWPPFKPPEHIYLYDSENVRVLFDRAGLEVLNIQPGLFKYNMLVVGGKRGRMGSESSLTIEQS